MFEQTFKNIDDLLYKDAGADSELDYIGQTSWVLFLRYLHDLEAELADTAALEGREHSYILDEEYRWNSWAMPQRPDGSYDKNEALAGDDLIDFVKEELWPYLADFKDETSDTQTIEYKIGEIFSELEFKIKSGFILREILEYADELPFKSSKEKHELSHLYETKIKNMGNAGRNGGQYYTPRPLIRAMIKVIDPKLGERIYDGAAGSCGFLCEAFEYLQPQVKSTSDLETLQERTLYGKEKKNLAYVIGTMNMILHGIRAPNLRRVNTLSEDVRQVQEKNRFDVILANPPFGGKERKEVQQNFDIKTGETAFLFMQHFLKMLRTGGRAAVVIKNTFLSNSDASALRKLLLESTQLHTILDMPGGTFQGAGVKTVVLFFEKGEPTRKIWYYQFDPGRNMGKTNPLNDEDLQDFLRLAPKHEDSDKSWTIHVNDVDQDTYDLSTKNPNAPEPAPLRAPAEILAEMEQLDEATRKLLGELKELI